MLIRAVFVGAALAMTGINAHGQSVPNPAQATLPPMSLPGPIVETRTQQRPLRPPLAGIDCTFGVACPIIWSPPKRRMVTEPPAK